MNNQLTIQDRVFSVEKDFNQVNAFKMNFAKEAQFALQKLRENQFLFDAAAKDPVSLEYALINIASIGISLNSALSEAFLVPRGGKVILDISYRGLIKLATDTGAIEWVQAEIVKAKDVFEYQGIGKAPIHKMNPFGDRGETIGVYCVARLSTGESLSTIMSKAECDAIKDKSAAGKKGPWVDHYEEMLKKCVIKRAAKLWPRSERVHKAIEVLNEYEGSDFNTNKAYTPSGFDGEIVTNDELSSVRATLKEKQRTEEALIAFLNIQFKSEAKTLEDLTPAQLEMAKRALAGKPKENA